MSVYEERRKRILSLASGFDTVVVTNPKNLFYVTDFWGGGVGVVDSDGTTLVTSVMEEKRAGESGKEVRVVAERGLKAIYEAVKTRSRGKVLLDGHDPRLKGKVDEELFLRARRKKDAEEVRRISQASKLMDGVYALVERELRPGRTELEVAAEVMRLATLEGLSPLPAEGSLSPLIVASGPNGALPHAELTKRKVRRGDMVVADIFFRYRGYCTDCTRTYGVGRVPDECEQGYAAVLEAQRKGLELTRPGAKSRDIHAAVTAVLKEHGVDAYFTHGTGHGVGIDIHEEPSVGPKSDDVLAEGDVVTVEPGIYLPGRFGVRIEDTVSLGRTARVLFDYTKELVLV